MHSDDEQDEIEEEECIRQKIKALADDHFEGDEQ
jgi:hypothetical protein